MTPDQISRAAETFARARREGVQFDALPPDCCIPDMDHGYAVQEALHEKLGGRIVGYKIGCTTAVMQKFLNITEPCAGSIQESHLYISPIELPHNRFCHVGVECEIAVRLACDLSPDGAPFDRNSVANAVGACMPAIEIVDDRYVDYPSLSAATLIADDFFGAGCVLGPVCTNWQQLNLGAVSAAMSINGKEVGTGIGAHVMGHPLEALAWLANTFARQNRGLEEGQIVLTGSIVETQWVSVADTVTVSVHGLGEVKVRFTKN